MIFITDLKHFPTKHKPWFHTSRRALEASVCSRRYHLQMQSLCSNKTNLLKIRNCSLVLAHLYTTDAILSVGYQSWLPKCNLCKIEFRWDFAHSSLPECAHQIYHHIIAYCHSVVWTSVCMTAFPFHAIPCSASAIRQGWWCRRSYCIEHRWTNPLCQSVVSDKPLWKCAPMRSVFHTHAGFPIVDHCLDLGRPGTILIHHAIRTSQACHPTMS